jgi:hypothetical protein
MYVQKVKFGVCAYLQMYRQAIMYFPFCRTSRDDHGRSQASAYDILSVFSFEKNAAIKHLLFYFAKTNTSKQPSFCTLLCITNTVTILFMDLCKGHKVAHMMKLLTTHLVVWLYVSRI